MGYLFALMILLSVLFYSIRIMREYERAVVFRLGRLIRYNSEYFRVRIRVSSAPAPINVEAVVLRNKKDPKIVRWEVH